LSFWAARRIQRCESNREPIAASAAEERATHQLRGPEPQPLPLHTLPKWEFPSTLNKSQPPCFSSMWKTRSEPRIKPVIARDTTYGVSLLTGTIRGSKFAIPRHEIPSHGNGMELEETMPVRRQARGDLPPVRSEGVERLGFGVSPAPETWNSG
jgi:hypothetical protein